MKPIIHGRIEHDENGNPVLSPQLKATLKAEYKRIGGNEKDFEIEKLLPKKNPVK